MESNWDLKKVEGDFEEDRKIIERAFDDFVLKWRDDKSYLENVDKLREALSDFENLEDSCGVKGNEQYYYWLKQELDSGDKVVKNKFLNVQDFLIKQMNKILFFEISLSKISGEKQKEFLEDSRLVDYRSFLKKIFDEAKHILSEEVERVLSLKEKGAFDMWVKMVESLLQGESVEIRGEGGVKRTVFYPELISRYMISKDKKIRDEAKVLFEGIMKKYEDVAENELNAVLESYKVSDELRGFGEPDASRIVGDMIDKEFIDSILEAVKSGFDISSRYYSLLAKLLGQEKIGYHERAMEVGSISREYSYKEAVDILRKVFGQLDEKFLEIFEDLLSNNLIDSHPKKGKNGGAFCVHFRREEPTFVLCNFTGKTREITTLAHETGHAINHVLMRGENAINYGNTKALAEVASIFMEDFVFEEILKDVVEEEKFQLLFKKIGEDIASVQRQISLYLFELELHSKYRKEGYLSKEVIGELFTKYMSGYMGDAVDMKGSRLWWIYWSHIRDRFYVYSYASGALVSKALQQRYREDNSFMEKIKEFLSTGKSKTPREVFDGLGIKIDKEFFMGGLDKMREELGNAEELARKLGKI